MQQVYGSNPIKPQIALLNFVLAVTLAPAFSALRGKVAMPWSPGKRPRAGGSLFCGEARFGPSPPSRFRMN
jgi:hypothetical protein